MKKAKLQTYRDQFESPKMKEDENIVDYFLQVDEVFNTLRGLGEIIPEQAIVHKVQRFLPMRFDSKVSVLEDIKDLDTITMDEIHGILTAYEMRAEKENPSRRESTIKASKKTRGSKQDCSKSSSDEYDHEESNFVKKL